MLWTKYLATNRCILENKIHAPIYLFHQTLCLFHSKPIYFLNILTGLALLLSGLDITVIKLLSNKGALIKYKYFLFLLRFTPKFLSDQSFSSIDILHSSGVAIHPIRQSFYNWPPWPKPGVQGSQQSCSENKAVRLLQKKSQGEFWEDATLNKRWSYPG